MSMKSVLIACVLATLTFGCANDRVAFVTSSSVGLNFDSTTRTASIAYDRVEGYFTPRYKNGALPPVMAHIETDRGIFNPQISQVYATGNAAKIASGHPTQVPADIPLLERDGDDIAFFGTSTALGVKVAFGATTPTSFLFGFGRREVSVLPLGQETITIAGENKLVDIYPSVFASIDAKTDASTLDDAGLNVRQFFATGLAAEQLAGNSAVNTAFEMLAEESVRANLSEMAINRHNAHLDSLSRIMLFVAPNGPIDRNKRDQLVTSSDLSAPTKRTLMSLNDAATFERVVRSNQEVVRLLKEKIP